MLLFVATALMTIEPVDGPADTACVADSPLIGSKCHSVAPDGATTLAPLSERRGCFGSRSFKGGGCDNGLGDDWDGVSGTQARDGHRWTDQSSGRKDPRQQW